MSMKSLASRLTYNGGDQLGRIKMNKLRSFKAALKNDYQSRMIKVPNKTAWPCLINNNTSGLKSDYDRKRLSVEFDSGLQSGDVFECLDDGTHWMVYLPTLTEIAYLRTEIIRCRYTLDVDGQVYWVYFQGPTETDVTWFQKQGVHYDEPNLSGTIYIKKDERTKGFFNRFTKIQMDGHAWEVHVVDEISVPGIIELEVREFYDDPLADLPVVEKEGCHEIIGREKVEQDGTYGYMIRDAYFNPEFSWRVEGNPRVEIESQEGKMCNVLVHDGAIRGFKLVYGNKNSGYHIDVTIERECNGVVGPKSVYPYDIVDYKSNVTGTYRLSDNRVAKIIERTDTGCTVEITSGRSGDFKVIFDPVDYDMIVEYPVHIESL